LAGKVIRYVARLTLSVRLLSILFAFAASAGLEFRSKPANAQPPPAAGSEIEAGQSDATSATSLRTAPSQGNPTPQVLTPEQVGAATQKIVGLVFLPQRSDVQPGGIGPVSGIDASRVPILNGPDFQAVAGEFIGRPISIEVLEALVQKTIEYTNKHNDPLVEVLVPEQDVQNGAIQVLVIDSRLGKVSVRGNRWFSAEDYTDAIRLQPGDPIRSDALNADLAWLNANPFRSVDAVFEAGADPGTTDIVLKATDRFPVRIFSSYANDGTQASGIDRGSTGFSWGDAFWQGHQLNYQFSHSLFDDKYFAPSASYGVPLPWRDTLTVSGSYAETAAPAGDGVFADRGQDLQFGLRYAIPLPKIPVLGGVTNELTAGLDYKRNNSDLDFGGTTVFQSTPEIDQLALIYTLGQTDKYGVTTLSGEGYLSPGGITGDNNDAAFALARAGATSRYGYLRLHLERTNYLLSNFSLIARASGQVSSANLLASEQLPIAGSQAVRGFTEDEIIGDQGYVTTLELRTPDMGPLSWIGITGVANQLQFLTFLDYGLAAPFKVVQSTDETRSAASVGVGFRYSIAPYLSLRMDYGWRIRARAPSDPNDKPDVLHVGLVAGY
jgi:hemolysin activation/secretion protein